MLIEEILGLHIGMENWIVAYGTMAAMEARRECIYVCRKVKMLDEW